MLIKIKTSDGNTYNIKNTNIISSKYQSDCSDDNELMIGFASASSFNFSIKSLDGLYENINFIDSKIELWNDEETTRKGIFNLNKITKKRHVISFETLDDMIKFDQKFKGATFPLSILDFINALCYQCKVSIGETINSSLVNCNHLINSDTEITGKNCREILQLICEATGNYAIIDSNGKLQFKWFDFKTIKKEIEYKELHDFEIEEINSKISGVEIYLDNEKYEVNSGGTYNLYLTENNPFFLDSDNDSRRLLLKNIYESQINNMDYYSFNLKTRIDYNLDVGDVIKVQDEKGTYHLGVVSNLEYNNDSNMIINSAGENRDREYNATSQGSRTQKEEAVKITENLNFRNYSIQEGNYQTLNSFNIENVNSKSEVFLNYLCEFSCIEESYNLEFDFYVNDTKTRSIPFIENHPVGVFSAGFKLVLDLENDINTIVINLKSNSGTIEIDKMKSTVTIVGLNCSPDGGGNQSEIRVSDNLEKISYSLYEETDYSKFFIIKDLQEVYNIVLKDEYINNLSDTVEFVDLLNDYINLNIDNINENLI